MPAAGVLPIPSPGGYARIEPGFQPGVVFLLASSVTADGWTIIPGGGADASATVCLGVVSKQADASMGQCCGNQVHTNGAGFSFVSSGLYHDACLVLYSAPSGKTLAVCEALDGAGITLHFPEVATGGQVIYWLALDDHDCQITLPSSIFEGGLIDFYCLSGPAKGALYMTQGLGA